MTVKLYAESSAVLAWLLGEPSGKAVREVLAGASLVLASELTLVECERALLRATATRGLAEAAAADRRARLASAATHWGMLKLGDEILARARLPFPREPVRTLDALHLSTALTARAALPGLALLSLDERVRSNATALGFEVLPE